MAIDFNPLSAISIDAPRVQRLFAALGRMRRRARPRIAAWLAQDLGAGALWTPVAIGAGIALYFSLYQEPVMSIGVGVLVSLLGGTVLLKRQRPWLLAGALIALGFVAADMRADRVATPILDRELGIRAVEGRVVSVERSDARERLVIEVAQIERLAAERMPIRVRISWRGEKSAVEAGDEITLLAGLSPPPPPAAPGSFDFGRQLFFQRIGAVGFAVSRPEAIGARRSQETLQSRLERLRAALTERITHAAPGQGGAIVAAVVTGKREAITEQSRASLRDAGLAHLLAISGLHMGLATGLIFFATRAGLAMIEPIAIRFPIKKWAAAAALLSGFAYLLLSGAGWSPRRAFIMTAIMLIAILLDRRAFSLRNVAIAATIILLTTPEALIHPGFQMSFAAATALIAVFEWWSGKASPMRDFSILARIRRYGAGLLVTDFVASLATAPFALYHFNRVAIYSLAANVLAMPLMAFWIMPAAVVGLLLTPFGADAFFWRIAATGVELILFIGSSVSAWPGAVSLTAQWPSLALGVIAMGGIWLALARSPLRYAGMAAPVIAFAMISVSKDPDVFVASSGQNAAVHLEADGQRRIIPFTARRDKFDIGVWREVVAAGEGAGQEATERLAQCGARGCVYHVRGRTVSVITSPRALHEDCRRADLVVALFPVRGADWRACGNVIDTRSAQRRGAHAVRFTDDGMEIRTTGERRGRRPWGGG